MKNIKENVLHMEKQENRGYLCSQPNEMLYKVKR